MTLREMEQNELKIGNIVRLTTGTAKEKSALWVVTGIHGPEEFETTPKKRFYINVVKLVVTNDEVDEPVIKTDLLHIFVKKVDAKVKVR